VLSLLFYNYLLIATNYCDVTSHNYGENIWPIQSVIKDSIEMAYELMSVKYS